ncbi:MAG: ester cyclase [Chloroflexota bacterium]|nr:ester cyclase [Chloroflexota bacterium]
MRRLLTLVTMLLAASLLAPFASAQDATPVASPDSGCPAPTEAEAETIANQYFDAFNTGDLEALDALLAPDYIHRGALGPDQDRDLHKERVQITRTGFPDAIYTIEDIIIDGDLVVIRHTMNGTNDGEYAGQAATGIAVEVSGIHIHRIECGLIAETWNEGDGLGLYQQLGLLPEPVGATPAAEDSAATAPQASPANLIGECQNGTAEENVAVAEQYLDVWNSKDVSLFDELAHPDVVHHWGQGVDTTGTSALKASTEAFFMAFPDMVIQFDQVIAQDDLVVIRWTLNGTQTGPFFEIEPTGNEATWSGINIYRVSCGKVVESWSEADGLGLRRQLGVLEDPTGATPAS